MRLSAETLLVLVVIAFFLKDSVRLLRRDEAVLVRGLGGRWRAGFGARGWRLSGLEPYLANPFLPHEAVVRLAWKMTEVPAPVGAPCRQLALPPRLPRLGVLAWAIWIELFIGLPLALAGRIDGLSPLAAIVVLYASVALVMLVVGWQRSALALSNAAFARLAFECIACPPYAANLVRRVAALQAFDEDFIHASLRLLASPQQHVVDRECLARVDEQIDAAPLDGSTLGLLQAARARFVREGHDERE